MATYASGRQTRDILIDAAGELAAELGFSNVSIRAVAQKADQNIGSIHYHFKSKEKLFEAALLRATKSIRENPFSKILEAFEQELNTPRGQAMVLKRIVHWKITNTFDSKEPWWYSRLIYQTMRSKGILRDILYNEVILPDIKSLQKLFRLIDPGLDEEEIFVQTMLLMTPIVFHADNAGSMLKIMGVYRYSDTYLQKLEDTIVRQAQLGLGLPLYNIL